MPKTFLVEFQAQAGKGGEVAALLRDRAYPSLDGATGFRAMSMFRDQADPDHVMEILQWEDEKAHQDWVGPVLAEVGQEFQALLAEQPRMVELDQLDSKGSWG